MGEIYELYNKKKSLQALFEDTRQLLEQCGYYKEAEALSKEISLQLEKAVPRIMFYGVYNSGKSSLINAITGKEYAKVGDVPTTATIQNIDYDGFTMVDTPGIVANDEHTEIAESEIKRSDVILFVVDDMGTFENKAVAVALVKIIQTGKPLIVVINQKNSDGIENGYSKKVRIVMEKISNNMWLYAERIGHSEFIKADNFIGMVPVNAKRGFDAKVKFENKAEAKEKLFAMSNLSELMNLLNMELRNSSGVRMLNPAYDMLRMEVKSVKERCIAKLSSEQSIQLNKLKSEILENKQHVLSSLIFQGRSLIEGFENEAFAKLQSGGSIEQAGMRLQEQLQKMIEQELKNSNITLRNSIDLHMARFQDMRAENFIKDKNFQLDISDLNKSTEISDELLKLIKGPVVVQDGPINDIKDLAVKEGNAKLIAPVIGGAGSIALTGGLSLPVVALAFIAGKLFDAQKKQKELEKRIDEFNEAAQERVDAMVSQVFELNNKLRMEINRMEQEYESSVTSIVESSFLAVLEGLEDKIREASNQEGENDNYIQQADTLLERINKEQGE